MKSICLFVTSLTSGGAEHQCVILSEMLVKRGYDVCIVTFSDIVDHYTHPDSVKRIKLAPGKSKFRKTLSIFRYFSGLNADCVITYGQRESFLCLLPLVFRKTKVIAGERNYTITCPNRMESFLWKYLYPRATYIVANSDAQCRYIADKRPGLKDKVKSITNYTDLSEYKYDNYIGHTPLTIGIFSRYTAQKNCERFARAVKVLKDVVTDSFAIVWYGNMHDVDGSANPEYETFLSQVQDLGISDVLILKDHVSNVPALLDKFDAICLPSLREGFSNSISEAICCGRPMLVSDVSDNSRMVKDGVNGFLFNPLDESSIVEAFRRFLNLSFEERKKMSEESRAIAGTLFDKSKFIDSYVDLIEN